MSGFLRKNFSAAHPKSTLILRSVYAERQQMKENLFPLSSSMSFIFAPKGNKSVLFCLSFCCAVADA